MVELAVEVEIAAPPATVWRVLTALGEYPQWNPFTPRVEGELAPGGRVVLHVELAPGRRVTQAQRVVELDPGRALGWETRLLHPALLRAVRRQTLEGSPGGTIYRSRDRMQGLLVPLVMALHRRDLERGFGAMAQALKARAEAA